MCWQLGSSSCRHVALSSTATVLHWKPKKHGFQKASLIPVCHFQVGEFQWLEMQSIQQCVCVCLGKPMCSNIKKSREKQIKQAFQTNLVVEVSWSPHVFWNVWWNPLVICNLGGNSHDGCCCCCCCCCCRRRCCWYSQNSQSYSSLVSYMALHVLSPNFIHAPQLEETLVGNSGGGATRALVVAMVRGVFGCEPKDRKNSAPRHSGTGIFTYMNGGFVWQVI